MEEMIIREIRTEELDILDDLLYLSIYQPEGSEPVPREVTKAPKVNVYIDSFGSKKDDYCLVADLNGCTIGAVWVRILADEIKGYGNIDDQTPEFAISLFKEYRNKGIGTFLMNRMIECLKEKGYAQASLSVQKQNYAVKMYQKLGFKIIRENEEDYLMVLKLKYN
jgi:ribosomal protein S18 acetylase RimI-like enzyme